MWITLFFYHKSIRFDYIHSYHINYNESHTVSHSSSNAWALLSMRLTKIKTSFLTLISCELRWFSFWFGSDRIGSDAKIAIYGALLIYNLQQSVSYVNWFWFWFFGATAVVPVFAQLFLWLMLMIDFKLLFIVCRCVLNGSLYLMPFFKHNRCDNLIK